MARPKGQYESNKIKTYNLIRGIAGPVTCFAKTKTLANRIGVGERQIYRYLHDLQQEDLIIVNTKRRFNKHNRCFSSIRHVRINYSISPKKVKENMKNDKSTPVTAVAKPSRYYTNNPTPLNNPLEELKPGPDIYFQSAFEKSCWTWYQLKILGEDPGMDESIWGPVVREIINRSNKKVG